MTWYDKYRMQMQKKDPTSRCWAFVISQFNIPQSSYEDYKNQYLPKIKRHSMTIDLKFIVRYSCLIGFITFQTHPTKSYVKHVLGYPAYTKAITILRSSDPLMYEDVYLDAKEKHFT